VFIDGQPVFEYLHHNDDGWRRFVIDTSRFKGERHAVRFEVESATPAWRTFGFAAEAIEEAIKP
jgi:hypothetical protein